MDAYPPQAGAARGYTVSEMDAQTIHTRATVDAEGELHTEQPLALRPGQYEITLIAEPLIGQTAAADDGRGPAPRAELCLPLIKARLADPAMTIRREDLYDD